MARELIFPGRYYCRWPFRSPRGYQIEEQRLHVAETAFFLVDVYGRGYDEGDPVPEYPTRFFEEMFYKERDVIRDRIRPALDAARAAGLKIVYTTNYWTPANWDASEFGKLCYRTETGWAGTLEQTVAGESDHVRFSRVIAPQPGDFLVNKTM